MATQKAWTTALLIAVAVLTMGQAKPDRTIDADSITTGKISAKLIELREGDNTVTILLPGTIVVGEKDKGTVKISASEGPSLNLFDTDGFGTTLGATSLVTTKTGESHKTSAASVVLIGKDHKVLVRAVSELARSTSSRSPPVLLSGAMKCPHCDTGIHRAFEKSGSAVTPTRANASVTIPLLTWNLYHQLCPECHDSILLLERTSPSAGWNLSFTAYPRSRSTPIPPEVLNPYRQDFSEASRVLADSAKASAALSRRCLQMILTDKLGATKRDLYYQIEEVIASGKLPSHIVDGLHSVRSIGNFAAHPSKSTSTGTIVDVVPGEAEWNLEVIEMLFDFCFVQPAIAAKRKAELNEKLKDMHKPLIP